MQPNHLSLVPSRPDPSRALLANSSPATVSAEQTASGLVQVTTDRRKLFWRAYLTWLATATDGEVEQFERVVAEHAHHVRPLIEAVTDALRLRETALRLPLTLLAELHASGWRPAFAAPSASPAASASAAAMPAALSPREGWPVVA